MKRRNILTIVVAGLLVVILLLFLVAFKVRVDEYAVVFTFGKATRDIVEPGLYWKLPYPIQTVRRFDARVHLFETKLQEVPTKDVKTLVVTLAVGWSIKNPTKFYKAVGDRLTAEGQIGKLIAGEANGVIGKHRFAELVSTDAKVLAFEKIEKEIWESEAVKKQADEEYGVALAFVRFSRLSLPDQVMTSVFDRMKAERGRKSTEYRSQGQAEADKIRADATSRKESILNDARAKATELRGEGDALAAEHYTTFNKHPDLAIFLRKLDALRALKENQTVILDTNTAPWDLLKGATAIPDVKTDEPSQTPSKAEGNE